MSIGGAVGNSPAEFGRTRAEREAVLNKRYGRVLFLLTSHSLSAFGRNGAGLGLFVSKTMKDERFSCGKARSTG
jgi:hypothetical protein